MNNKCGSCGEGYMRNGLCCPNINDVNYKDNCISITLLDYCLVFDENG